jgi:branched-chain amino acid transport system substrate-binding protein
MIRRRTLFGSAILAGLALFAAGCNSPSNTGGGGGGGTSGGGGNTASGDVIPVGAYLSLSGDEATFGAQTREGIELAVKTINDAGGINGKKIELKVENDESDATKAASAVTKLVTGDKVVAVLGEIASSRSLAAAPICQSNKVPMISPSSTNVKVTQVGDYIFRVCFTDDFQAFVCAKFARENLKADTAAILVDNASAYSQDFGKEFKKSFEALGGKIVQEAAYSPADTDFQGQLTNIKTANPKVILVPGYYKSAGAIAKQAKELGISAPLLGGDGWNSPDLFATAGTGMEGNYFSDHIAMDKPNDTVKKFVEEFKKQMGADKTPGTLTALGYDAMMILADAMKRAKSLDGTGIRDALAETKDFEGVTGSITINSQRNADKPAVVVQVKGHDFKWTADVNR